MRHNATTSLSSIIHLHHLYQKFIIIKQATTKNGGNTFKFCGCLEGQVFNGDQVVGRTLPGVNIEAPITMTSFFPFGKN